MTAPTRQKYSPQLSEDQRLKSVSREILDSTARLLSLDSTKETQRVHKHDMVRELRLVVETVDLAAVLGNGSEGDNVVEIEPQSRVSVVNMRFHILLGALIERNDSKSRTSAAEMLENPW
jgi:hypothetical protein